MRAKGSSRTHVAPRSSARHSEDSDGSRPPLARLNHCRPLTSSRSSPQLQRRRSKVSEIGLCSPSDSLSVVADPSWSLSMWRTSNGSTLDGLDTPSSSNAPRRTKRESGKPCSSRGQDLSHVPSGSSRHGSRLEGSPLDHCSDRSLERGFSVPVSPIAPSQRSSRERSSGLDSPRGIGLDIRSDQGSSPISLVEERPRGPSLARRDTLRPRP